MGTGNVDSSQADNSAILVRLDGDAEVLSRICRGRLSSVVLIFVDWREEDLFGRFGRRRRR